MKRDDESPPLIHEGLTSTSGKNTIEKYRSVEERPMLNFLLKMSDMMNGTHRGLDGVEEKISELKTEQ